jgi:hypothetical protein
MSKTCFVLMAIGDQEVNGQRIDSSSLKVKYDQIIRQAIMKARPDLKVVRADEISRPGTITTDIITRIMISDYVIADITYPNPNVFYELGLRHAHRNGTILIRDKQGPKAPFDLSHLRHIEYDSDIDGFLYLSSKLLEYFDEFDINPFMADNAFQELIQQNPSIDRYGLTDVSGTWECECWRMVREDRREWLEPDILELKQKGAFITARNMKRKDRRYFLRGEICQHHNRYINGSWKDDDPTKAYSGVFQLNIGASGTILQGQWLSISQSEVIKHGGWKLTKS